MPNIGHVILMAPDETVLARAWELLAKEPVPREYCCFVLGKQTMKIKETGTPLKDIPLIWILHAETGCVFVEDSIMLERDLLCQEIGTVTNGSIMEAKLILRKLGWKRDEIEALEITDITTYIPF